MNGSIAENARKYQHLLIAAVSFAVGVILLALVILPQAWMIPKTNDQINQTKNSLASVNRKIADLDQLDLNKMQADLETAAIALPYDQEIPGALTQTLYLVRANGLSLSSVNFANPATGTKGVNSMLVKAEVLGSPEALNNFIKQLKVAPRVMQVDTLTTSASNTEKSMQISIALNTYFEELPKSQALNLDQPVQKLTDLNLNTLREIKGYVDSLKPVIEATSSSSTIGKSDPFQ